MENLRFYSVKDIEAFKDEFERKLAEGEIDRHAYGHTLGMLVFRDLQGGYWALAGGQTGWFTNSEAGWKGAARPKGHLEGLALLDLEDNEHIEGVVQMQDEQVIQPRPSAEGMLEINRIIYHAYKEGRILLQDAGEMLVERVLFDRKGRPWLPGVRTGIFYYLEDLAWVPAGQQPTEGELVRFDSGSIACPKCSKESQGDFKYCPYCGAEMPRNLEFESPEAVVRAFLFILKGIGSAPEALSAEWDPPAWYPGAVVKDAMICPICQQENLSRSVFCCRCGSLLASARNQAAVETSASNCRFCGEELKPGRKFCAYCGKPVS